MVELPPDAHTSSCKPVFSAIEFFSGIGAFAEACRGSNLEISAAFDQGEDANRTYALNFDAAPRTRNLDSISAAEVPAADIWWMSPPCEPYTRRGLRRDEEDPRARSLLNLINLIPDCRPQVLFLENVRGFLGSRVHGKLRQVLGDCSYDVKEIELCSSELGTPMKRPRTFVVGTSRGGARFDTLSCDVETATMPLSSFLAEEFPAAALVDERTLERYRPSLHVVRADEPGGVTICFTSNYWKCARASGSFLELEDGKIRRFLPDEILRLLGFSESFRFPSELAMQARWRLAGNSVDVRCIRFVLGLVSRQCSAGPCGSWHRLI